MPPITYKRSLRIAVVGYLVGIAGAALFLLQPGGSTLTVAGMTSCVGVMVLYSYLYGATRCVGCGEHLFSKTVFTLGSLRLKKRLLLPLACCSACGMRQTAARRSAAQSRE